MFYDLSNSHPPDYNTIFVIITQERIAIPAGNHAETMRFPAGATADFCITTEELLLNHVMITALRRRRGGGTDKIKQNKNFV